MSNIFIIGGSSDIGSFLIRQYLAANHKVVATYRNKDHLKIESLPNRENLTVFPLDIRNHIQRFSLVEYFRKTELVWDTCIFLNGTTLPIGKLMDINMNVWERSILENALIPCEFVQNLYTVRNKEKICNICFFSGGGVNGAFDNYSAYAISKTILHKFVELLDSEYEDLNPFIIGPSYVKTKIHQETLNSESSDEIKGRVRKFLNSGKGTPLKDIFSAILWCCEQGKPVIGGRNLAVAHDDWKDSLDLTEQLRSDKDKFKLRRKT